MKGNLSATARAYSNIAFIKYWGNLDDALRLPANGSLSMNLLGLHTTTNVRWLASPGDDSLTINDKPAQPNALRRASAHLDVIRERLDLAHRAEIRSTNNFPMGAGIASSASAFAALTLAAVEAAGTQLSQRELSALARRGSGSASRSIPPGFVEWYAGHTHESSYAESIAGPDHWDLVDIIALVSREHKRVDSTAGHATAASSMLQPARLGSAEGRLRRAKAAILRRDFERLAAVVEEDSNLMHAIMMTSKPALFYWQPTSLEIMLAVRQWRERDGLQVCYTLDAGPNVHCICARADAQSVLTRLKAFDGVKDALYSEAGPAAHLVADEQRE